MLIGQAAAIPLKQSPVALHCNPANSKQESRNVDDEPKQTSRSWGEPVHSASGCSCQFHFSAFDAITSQRLPATGAHTNQPINKQTNEVAKRAAARMLHSAVAKGASRRQPHKASQPGTKTISKPNNNNPGHTNTNLHLSFDSRSDSSSQ